MKDNTAIIANALNICNQIRSAAEQALERKCTVVWNKERRDIYATTAKEDGNIQLLDYSEDPLGIYTKTDITDADIMIAVSLIQQFDADGLNAILIQTNTTE